MKKPKKAKELFGKRVSFDTIFQNVTYVSDEPQDFSRKLFEGDEFVTVKPKEESPGLLGKKPLLPRSQRKVVFLKQDGEGIIIGQTSKHEGLYDPGYRPGFFDNPGDSDYEQASLVRKKTYTFWVVATGINTTVLAEKSTSKLIR